MEPLPVVPHSSDGVQLHPALYPEKCLRSRLNTNQCQKCLESCPTNALSVDNRIIDLDITKCSGCMSCVAACPQDALISGLSLDQFLASFHSGGDFVISCIHQMQNHPDEISIPCVGLLSKEVLASILLYGCRSVSFTLAGCSECFNTSASSVFIGNCKQLLEELDDLYSTQVFFVEKTDQIQHPPADRRSYLATIVDFALKVSRQSLLPPKEPLSDNTRSNRYLPVKTRLVKKMLMDQNSKAQKKILALFGHTLSFTEACNCCPLCKGICPTGAIQIVRSDLAKRLKFEMLDCSGCGLCVEFCKKNAVSLGRVTFNISKFS